MKNPISPNVLVLLKVYDEDEQSVRELHFTYVERKVWEKFCSKVELGKRLATIKQWVKEDFNIYVKTRNDLAEAKESIRMKYKEKYPELYISERINNNQGWVRMWLTIKIKELIGEA